MALRTDNVIAALGQSNRVRKVNLHVERWHLEEVLAHMQVPFPELTDLRLSTGNWISTNLEPIDVPDSFLDGSAPRLRNFTLHNIPFLGLPKLLLSATHLVELRLTNIPDFGYISPEAMTDLLSMLSRLRILCFEFRDFHYRKGRSLPPPKHSILPSLCEFRFTGITRYLEALVTHIDTPQLDGMHIIFLDSSNFDCPRLAQFINRTPTFRARDKAHLKFIDWNTSIALLARSSTLRIETRYLSETFVRGLFNSPLHPLSTVEVLKIEHEYWKEESPILTTQWLQLSLQFTAVKKLYLDKKSAPAVAAALQELVGSRITEVLPSLQNVFVEALKRSGPFQKNIRQFVKARRLSGYPVAISISDSYKLVWNWEEEEQETASSCMATWHPKLCSGQRFWPRFMYIR
jgi:hypothetical protein